VVNGLAGSVSIFNHDGCDPRALTTLGVIPAQEVAAISGGLLCEDVPVRLNRAILDYDCILICGPVFPHEVAGFSGGTKYFFPGIAGREIIDFTHWLGALVTSFETIGVADTPVRRSEPRFLLSRQFGASLRYRAASMIRALLIVSIALLVGLPVLAQRGGGGHGGGGMHGFGGGMHGGYGGMHPGLGGSIHRGFHQPFHNNFRFRNFDRSLSRFAFGTEFDGSNADYGNPLDYGSPSDGSQRYDSLNTGHQPSVSPVIAVQLSEHIYSYVPVDSRNAPVVPDIHEYVPPPSQTNSTYVPTLYLIAFQDNSIRAALAYWTEGSTLRYVTLAHEQKQAPLASVDRVLSERLNGERHVLFRLPSR
jgi:hypothetical protein